MHLGRRAKEAVDREGNRRIRGFCAKGSNRIRRAKALARVTFYVFVRLDAQGRALSEVRALFDKMDEGFDRHWVELLAG